MFNYVIFWVKQYTASVFIFSTHSSDWLSKRFCNHRTIFVLRLLSLTLTVKKNFEQGRKVIEWIKHFFIFMKFLYLFYVFYYDANTHSIREFFNIYFLNNIRIKVCTTRWEPDKCLSAHMWWRLYWIVSEQWKRNLISF